MKPARRPKLAIVRKPTWLETHGIASRADHQAEHFVFQRAMRRDDGSVFEPSGPPFQRNLTNLYRDARMIAALLIERLLAVRNG